MAVNPELVKQLAELVDGDSWVMADLLVEEFPADQWGEAKAGSNTGLGDALREYELALAREKGITLTAATLATKRSTALNWPASVRTEAAPYVVHEMLRGPDRFMRLASYQKRNKGKPLSKRDVQRYRYDDDPPPMVTWEAQLRRRLTATVRTALLAGKVAKGKDWWNAADPDARAVAVAALRDLANMLEQDSA